MIKILQRIRDKIDRIPLGNIIISDVIRGINEHGWLLEDQAVVNNGGQYQYQYLFNQKVTLKFVLYMNSKYTELEYKHVSRLCIVQFNNLFYDCRVFCDCFDSYEQFYIMNDIYKLDFIIKEEGN